MKGSELWGWKGVRLKIAGWRFNDKLRYLIGYKRRRDSAERSASQPHVRRRRRLPPTRQGRTLSQRHRVAVKSQSVAIDTAGRAQRV